jgi:hypothetical protein
MNYIKSATIPLTKTTTTTTNTPQKLDEFSKLDYFNYKLGIDIGPLPLQFEYLTKFKENDESRINMIKTIGHFQNIFEKSLSAKNQNNIKDDAFRIYKMHTFLSELEKMSIEYIDNLIKFNENNTVQSDLHLSSFNLTKYNNEQSYNRMRDNMSYYIGKRNNQLWELKNLIERKKWIDVKQQYHLIARSVYIIYEYETKIRPLLF